jgi:phosphoribosylamine-glycine ligase
MLTREYRGTSFKPRTATAPSTTYQKDIFFPTIPSTITSCRISSCSYAADGIVISNRQKPHKKQNKNQPTNKLQKKKFPYKKLLYTELIVNKSNYTQIIKFNYKFKNPKTQNLMLLIQDDLLEIFLQSAKGNLTKKEITLREGASCIVVLAANGYPNDYVKNIPLVLKNPGSGVEVFHAGTNRTEDGKIFSTGGRILGVSSYSTDLRSAVDRAYSYLKANPQSETFYRSDIGHRAL